MPGLIRRTTGTCVPQPAQAAWRDASYSPTVGVAEKYHIMTDVGTAACSGAPLIEEGADDARLIPHDQRCQRNGCREQWNRPNAGERWKSRNETRTVVDRTLGGDVIYVSGRFRYNAPREQCSKSIWDTWQRDAKELEGIK